MHILCTFLPLPVSVGFPNKPLCTVACVIAVTAFTHFLNSAFRRDRAKCPSVVFSKALYEIVYRVVGSVKVGEYQRDQQNENAETPKT